MMRVHDLTGGQLDLWVARALAKDNEVAAVYYGGAWVDGDGQCYLAPPGYRSVSDYRQSLFTPSTDGRVGQPIVERMVDILRKRSAAEEAELAHPDPNFKWKAEAWVDGKYACGFGPTLLIAAMRCYVTSIFGFKVSDNS